MQFMMKEGVLYTSDFHKALVKMKSTLLGPQKKICKISGDLLLVASIKSPDTTKANPGDVRNHEYLLTDKDGNVVGCAHPEYANGDDLEVTGWPICRMPRVDHAEVTVGDATYVLTMHNSQNYSLTDAHHTELLNIMHRGLAGGWVLDEHCDLSPEILCGMFAFCRYIEQENEFWIV